MMMLTARVTLLLMIGLAAYSLARRRSSSFRHVILLCIVAAALLMPLAPHVTPFSLPLAVARPEFRSSSAGRISITTDLATHVAQPTDPIPLSAIWLAGTLLLLARTGRSTIAAELLRHRTGKGGLRWTDAIPSAATVGLLHPIVLISTRRRWNDNDLHAVIAHERCHAARHDPAAQLLFEIAVAVYWFHPLIWIVRRLAALDRERACDDGVIAQGFDSQRYAELLLRLASPQSSIGIPISRASELAQRLLSIVEVRRSRAAVSRFATSAIALFAVLTASSIAAVTLALPIDDPLSERLAPVETLNTFTPASAGDAALLATLTKSAKKTKMWEGDLVGERARWALSRARGGELLQPLREALDDGDWRVRAYAAWALAQAGDRQSVPRLAALLNDPVWRMRSMAAFALHAAADPRAAEAMRRAGNDSAWQVRIEVAAYFGAFHEERYREILETMTADRHVAVRTAAEEALKP